ncbi:hypothetical protein HDU67_007891 [Dinochytrium kinnereticum]|nr:hypothetical protein HDU67_007891 [Dinochytrium kinnereticum]
MGGVLGGMPMGGQPMWNPPAMMGNMILGPTEWVPGSVGYYGGRGGDRGPRGMSSRLGPPVRGGRSGGAPRNMPVDPRSRITYDDLDAPKGEDVELNYD